MHLMGGFTSWSLSLFYLSLLSEHIHTLSHTRTCPNTHGLALAKFTGHFSPPINYAEFNIFTFQLSEHRGTEKWLQFVALRAKRAQSSNLKLIHSPPESIKVIFISDFQISRRKARGHLS